MSNRSVQDRAAGETPGTYRLPKILDHESTKTLNFVPETEITGLQVPETADGNFEVSRARNTEGLLEMEVWSNSVLGEAGLLHREQDDLQLAIALMDIA